MKLQKALKISGLVLMGFFIAVSFVSLFFTPYDIFAIDLNMKMGAPSEKHILGYDFLGRDLFSRIMVGIRNSLLAAVSALSIGAPIGVLLGLYSSHPDRLSSYPKVEHSLKKVINFVFGDFACALPDVIIGIILVSVMGANFFLLVAIVAFGIVNIFFRLTYFSAKAVWCQDFVKASVMMGRSRGFIMKTHIFPNIRGTIINQLPYHIITCLLIESGLTYLGVGLPVQMPSLGFIIMEASDLIFLAPSQILIPSLVLSIMILSLSLISVKDR